MDNPLLKEPLQAEHIKNRLLGHWGSSPGLVVHLRPPEPADQEVRPEHDLHGRAGTRSAGRARVRATWRARTPRSIPDKSEDEEGLREFFKQFSFPGGIGSHCTPETPGIDSRRRRTGLRAVARLRGRVRQSRPDRRRGGRRRRIGDRPAGDVLAHQQVSEPACATARCCRSFT